MTTSYPPPEGFGINESVDPRSHDEIVSALNSYQPVVGDKNVWTFWDSGWEHLAPWCQRSIINWVRRLGSQWTVRVLNNVPGSPNYLSSYVPEHFLPIALKEGTIAGPPQHISDLLRLPLLYVHGGVWMDAGMLLLRHLDDICWRTIADPSNSYEMAGFLMPLRAEAGTMLNGFIATRRGNEMVRRWHEVYRSLWEGKTSAEGFSKSPLLAHLPPLEVQHQQLNCPPLLISAEALGDYLAHFLALERLQHLQDPHDDFDGAEYFANRVFLLKAEDHLYYAQRITGWDGRKQYNLLRTKTFPGAEGYQEAKDFVDGVLRESVMMKLSHGPPCGLENLASIWDEEEHSEDDVATNSFGAYLRYGSVHWNLNQARLSPTRLPNSLQTYLAGILEPINT